MGCSLAKDIVSIGACPLSDSILSGTYLGQVVLGGGSEAQRAQSSRGEGSFSVAGPAALGAAFLRACPMQLRWVLLTPSYSSAEVQTAIQHQHFQLRRDKGQD